MGVPHLGTRRRGTVGRSVALLRATKGLVAFQIDEPRLGTVEVVETRVLAGNLRKVQTRGALD